MNDREHRIVTDGARYRIEMRDAPDEEWRPAYVMESDTLDEAIESLARLSSSETWRAVDPPGMKAEGENAA